MYSFDEFCILNIDARISGAQPLEILSNFITVLDDACMIDMSTKYTAIADIVNLVVSKTYYIVNIEKLRNWHWKQFKKSIYIVIEDSDAGYQFWNAVCGFLDIQLYSNFKRDKDGKPIINCEIVKSLLPTFRNDISSYYIVVLDNPAGRLDMRRDILALKTKYASSNIVITESYPCFEYAILSFSYFLDWLGNKRVLQNECVSWRQEYLDLFDNFDMKSLNRFKSNLTKQFSLLKKASNYEQTGSLLLRRLTCDGAFLNNLVDGFSITKGVCGNCWIRGCNQCKDCTLQLTEAQKLECIFNNSVLYTVFKEVYANANFM